MKKTNVQRFFLRHSDYELPNKRVERHKEEKSKQKTRNSKILLGMPE